MDPEIEIKVEAEYLSSEDYSNKQESNDNQDCEEHFSENSEVTHSSSNNVNNNEGLNLDIKQEEQNVPIKDELAFVNQSNFFDPQDEHMDLDSANSFLWQSNLKKEKEKSVVTPDEFMGEPQFNEIQKLNYPSVFERDFNDTREEIWKQYQNEDYMKTLRQKRLKFYSQIHSKVPKCSYESTDKETFKGHLITHLGQSTSVSESVPYPFKKRSTQSDIIVIDDSSDEEHSEIIDIEEEELSNNDQPHRNTMFKCQLCSYSTLKNNDFVAHCLSHVTGKLFQCDHCNFKTNYEPTLKRHKFQCLKKTEKSVGKRSIPANENKILNNHLSLSEVINILCNKDKATVGILKCLECTFETKNLKFFNLHLQIHAEVKKCTECIFESKEAETFKDHLVSHFIPQSCMKVTSKSYDKRAKGNHKDSNIENGNIKLNHLASESSDSNPPTDFKKSANAHSLNEDVVVELQRCDHCDFETYNGKELDRHYINCLKLVKSRSTKNSIDTDSFSLSELINFLFNEEGFSDQNSLNLVSGEVFKCSDCSFESKNQKALVLHSQIHSVVHKCTECSFEINNKDTFKNHLITHINGYNNYSQMKNEYVCDMCDFKTEFHPSLISHLLLHNKDKGDCGYITTNLENLKVYTLSDIISMIYNDENEINQDKNLNSETKLHKCSRCIFECNDEQQLSEHLSSHSTEEKFICSQCSFEGINQSDLDSHLKTHSTFKCSKCSYEILSIASLNSHSCELQSNKVFKCLGCNFETKNEKHFTLHSQIHAKLRKCTECDFSHLRRNKFHHHLLTHLPKKLYSCTECGYKTNYINKLKLHLLNHTGMKVFHCSKCDYKTNQKGNLRNHMENHLESKSFRCSECNYSTSQSFSLKLHILDHSQKKLFLCSECDYGCNNKTRMSRHVLQHSREKLYKCSRCDFETNYMKNLKDHEARRHGGSFSYACSHCDFKCYKKSSLTAHSVIHSKTKLLKCPECSYQCNANLKLHMINMHSKTKMYKCSHCKYEGNHRSNFLTHIRTHSNERKYSCTECNFASNRKDNLKVHMTTHLKEKLSCADCSYKCSNKHQLKRHILSH